jgi:hypothetical protein
MIDGVPPGRTPVLPSLWLIDSTSSMISCSLTLSDLMTSRTIASASNSSSLAFLFGKWQRVNASLLPRQAELALVDAGVISLSALAGELHPQLRPSSI